MPDDSPARRNPYRLWIALAVALILILLSVDFFGKFSNALANQDVGQEQVQIAANPAGQEGLLPVLPGPADQEMFLPDLPGPKAPESQAAGKTIILKPSSTLPDPPAPGTTRVSPLDGMKLIYIPASMFRLGANVKINQPGQHAHARPTVKLDAFWISQTQVTNAMYARCVAARACHKAIRKLINPHYYNAKFASHPVVYVTWPDAVRYCNWAGGNLPTEAQWEKAARGSGKRPFQWGERAPVSRRANVGNHQKTTVPVGSYPAGASPYGVLDMGGNVREWVIDWFALSYTLQPPYENPQGPDSGKLRVLKGASWHDSVNYSMIESRFAHQPGSAGNNRGFRCAFSP
ncbi:MAG: SUMF1/EgtB/PvdO family nonheme iron enzyme [Anaerolineaceae bacterium]